MAPEVDSASNRNEYREYFVGVRAKSGYLNFLEPSGPLRACNGTALPLPFHLSHYALWFLTYTLLTAQLQAMFLELISERFK